MTNKSLQYKNNLLAVGFSSALKILRGNDPIEDVAKALGISVPFCRMLEVTLSVFPPRRFYTLITVYPKLNLQRLATYHAGIMVFDDTEEKDRKAMAEMMVIHDELMLPIFDFYFKENHTVEIFENKEWRVALGRKVLDFLEVETDTSLKGRLAKIKTIMDENPKVIEVIQLIASLA